MSRTTRFVRRVFDKCLPPRTVDPENVVKRISAMMRIRNERQFLEVSVLSIIDAVDEVVLIDNASTDGTDEVIASLKQRFPDRINALEYPHAIARCGEESVGEVKENPDSVHLLSTYYNWCMERCRYPFILKWDGDMIATDDLLNAIAEFRESSDCVLSYSGCNVAPGFQRAILDGAGHEPSLFYREGARYVMGSICERLTLPRSSTKYLDTVGFLHLKYCKNDPRSNHSPNFAVNHSRRCSSGPELDPGLLCLVRKWSPYFRIDL